jgi:hypothetical protein
MLYREIVCVFREIHKNVRNALCGQNVYSLNLKPGVT